MSSTIVSWHCRHDRPLISTAKVGDACNNGGDVSIGAGCAALARGNLIRQTRHKLFYPPHPRSRCSSGQQWRADSGHVSWTCRIVKSRTSSGKIHTPFSFKDQQRRKDQQRPKSAGPKPAAHHALAYFEAGLEQTNLQPMCAIEWRSHNQWGHCKATDPRRKKSTSPQPCRRRRTCAALLPPMNGQCTVRHANSKRVGGRCGGQGKHRDWILVHR